MNGERWSAVGGFAALAVAAAGVAFERATPNPAATPAEIADFYARNHTELLAQSLLFVLSSGIFLWFLGGLRAFLARAEGEPARLSSVAYAAGIGWIVVSVTVQAPQIALARAADPQPQVAAAVNDVGLALATIADVPIAVLVAAIGVLSLRHRAFPVWLGWSSAVVAVVHLAGWCGIVVRGGPLAPGGWVTFVLYPVFVLWLVAVLITMYRRAGN